MVRLRINLIGSNEFPTGLEEAKGLSRVGSQKGSNGVGDTLDRLSVSFWTWLPKTGGEGYSREWDE